MAGRVVVLFAITNRVRSRWVRCLEASFGLLGVAASVSEWTGHHSLTLAATRSRSQLPAHARSYPLTLAATRSRSQLLEAEIVGRTERNGPRRRDADRQVWWERTGDERRVVVVRFVGEEFRGAPWTRIVFHRGVPVIKRHEGAVEFIGGGDERPTVPRRQSAVGLRNQTYG